MAAKSTPHDLVVHVENSPPTSEKDREAAHDGHGQRFSSSELKKIYRRIDARLVVPLGMIYCISLIDRLNISLANIAGMGVDLELIGARYNIIVLIFSIPYVLFQPATVVLLRKVGPRIFLVSICFSWGILMIGSGFVRKWTDMVAIRVLLGTLEGGLFPGCAYLLACWYPRHMLQIRNAAFYMIGSVGSAFAGILAYGISQMNGLGSGDGLGQRYGPSAANPQLEPGRLPGIAGWRWIFIIEGLMTVLIAVVSVVLVVDFPENSTKTVGWRFLNDAEANEIVSLIESDRQDVHVPKFNIKSYLAHALDWKLWGFGLLFLCCAVQNFAIAYFLPVILQQSLGYDVAKSLCLTTPPTIAAAIAMAFIGHISDKKMLRSPGIIFCALIGLIGLIVVRFASNNGARYFAIFLVSIGSGANVPAILTWKANNVRGQWKRALGSAILISGSAIGSIIGPVTFRTQDAPSYNPGLYTCMVASAILIIVTLIFDFYFLKANKSAERNERILEGLLGFRYTL